MIKLTDILKEILLTEGLSSKEQEALEDLFLSYVDQNYTAIDGNEIKTDKFEDIFNTSIEDLELDEDNEEYINFLKSIKNKLISHLIDNIGEKIEVEISGTPQYFYSPFVKDNTIGINFIPLNYSEEKDTKYDNPKGTKIDWHPLEIEGYKFYAYKTYNPEIKLGKGKNTVEFVTTKIPGDDTTTYSLATSTNPQTKKISEDTLKRRLILMNYLKQNDVPFLIDTRDPSRSYIQVPLTYVNINQPYKSYGPGKN
jgi:hypothetical protein